MTCLSSTAGLRKLAAISVVLLCGCPGTPPESKTVARPFRGQEVELVVPASYQLPALWDVALSEWMDQSGATVRWSEYTGLAAAGLALIALVIPRWRRGPSQAGSEPAKKRH